MKDEDDDGDENEEEDDQLSNKFFPSSASQIQPLPGGPVEPKKVLEEEVASAQQLGDELVHPLWW